MSKIIRETETIELKKSTSELKEALISIYSILNKHGSGEIYFGIRNDGNVVGQQVSDKTLRNISKSISDHIEPKIFPVINEIVLDGKTCIKVAIDGADAPYFAKGKAYIRVSDEDRQLTAKELEKIILKQNKNNLHWDDAEVKVEFKKLKTGFLVIFDRLDKSATELEPILESGAQSGAHVTHHVTTHVEKLLFELNKNELGRKKLMENLNLKDRKNFIKLYLEPALEHGFIQMTIPDKPRSINQRYRLTDKGRKLFK